MLEALVTVLAVFTVGTALAAFAAIGASYWYLRRHRRHAGVPLRWSISQSHAARLHRRLHTQCDRSRQALSSARARGVEPILLDGAADDLIAQAHTLDARLVAASLLPLRERHKQLMTLRWRVIEHGRISSRVCLMAGDAGMPELSSTDATFADLALRLQSLAEARRELRSA